MIVLWIWTLSVAAAESAEELIHRMRGVWDGLDSYTTSQVIQERIRGELGDAQSIVVAFRKPWEIQLNWQDVHPGRKVYWCASRHDGDVQVYAGGFAGRAVGILSFRPDNGLLKRDTNYSPADAGFGYLVKLVSGALAPGATPPTFTEPTLSSVRGQRVSVIQARGITHPRMVRAELVVYQSTGLPARFTGWNAQDQITERYEWYDTVIDLPIVESTHFDAGYAR